MKCNSKEHLENGCLNDTKWLLRLHNVDNCKDTSEERLCQECFEDRIDHANAIIKWGMSGTRSPLCGECHRPMVRLSKMIEDIALV